MPSAFLAQKTVRNSCPQSQAGSARPPGAAPLCQHARMPSKLLPRRRALALAGAALCGLRAAHAAPPLRNLSVEMRVSEASLAAKRGAQGSVTIGSRGGPADARGSVVVQAGSARQALEATQRVLVLNGGRATLRVTQGVPVEDTEIWWTPWGPGAALRSQWVELSNGFEVRPLWPGGDAPVTLEVSAQRSAPGPAASARMPGSRDALPPQWTLMTTVLAPLGEWVTVAELHGRQAAVSNGFGAATASRQRELQLRVSLP